jgi:class 3 adenylate cyclase/tetratricopeptide (TPR) repeat protein
VAGFTSIAERLDPEEVHGVMDRCFSLLANAVHAYEGTINQFTGDGIMALFGAPLAHENAPERAVLAALDIQAALDGFSEEVRREFGVDFRMRIGAHTGPVVVGRIGDDLRMDYTAIGDTTNLAARLQAAAPAGGILISETTARLVGRRFQLEAIGPVALKGKAEAVSAHRVVRALPRAPLVAPAEGGLTPLVGRDGELAALERLLAEVAAGHGQVAFVVGDAGIGKSRLLHELRLRPGATDATWLVGRCISFGRSIPFLPLMDLLRGALRIDHGDDPATIAEKVRVGVRVLGRELEATEPYLRSLLAIDAGDPAIAAMAAGPRHFATFEALKRLLLGLAARDPLVLLIEDLHWIDPASEDFLAYILDAVARAPILMLCTHRPEYLSRLAARSYVTRVTLQPLSREDTASMASAVLGTSDLPEQVAALVAQKTDGNPFFIEEVTKSLLEAGALARDATGRLVVHRVDDAIIPDSIHDVIQARIDRLGDEPKRAIQVASVIGREFALRLLQRATEFGDRATELVSELRSLELIYEKSGVPELAYMFKHALTHDVAYAGLLLQRRRQLHRTIGLAIEELYGDRLAEHWETLAHHFHRAEAWPKAFDYLVKAADRARAAYANAEAVHFYRLALETAERIDVPRERRAELLESRAHAHKAVSEFPESIAAYRAALELTEDAPVRARIETALAEALWYAHEFDASIAAARRALEICGERPEERATAGEAFGVLGIVHIVRGQLEEGARFNGEAFRLGRESGHRRLRAQSEGIGACWRIGGVSTPSPSSPARTSSPNSAR